MAGGCSGPTPGPAGGQFDSPTLAARAARRGAFLKEQEELTRQYEALKQESLRAQPFRAVLMLQRPTVIAFYPGWMARLYTAALHAFLESSKAIAAEAGWAFEERHSGSLGIFEPRSQARYAVPLPADSMGFVLAAPVHIPQVLYGKKSGSLLGVRLRTLRDWLPGAARELQAGL